MAKFCKLEKWKSPIASFLNSNSFSPQKSMPEELLPSSSALQRAKNYRKRNAAYVLNTRRNQAALFFCSSTLQIKDILKSLKFSLSMFEAAALKMSASLLHLL